MNARIERVLTNDPHRDCATRGCGYPEAIDFARGRGIRLPMI